MSLILMINGILNILMSWLFFFYTNKYRHFVNQMYLGIYSVFSLYFLFIGFLRIRIAFEIDKWFNGLEYSFITVFNVSNIFTCLAIITFLYLGIKFKGKITTKDGNNTNNKKDMDLDKE